MNRKGAKDAKENRNLFDAGFRMALENYNLNFTTIAGAVPAWRAQVNAIE